MEGIFKKLIVENFQRKLISFLAAIAVWIFVNNSITSTRTFTKVSIRIVNLPVDKTIRGLMSNGVLDRKITISLTGTKDVIEQLDSQDFEVVIDASEKGDEWIVQISKKSLVSLNPDIELMHNITHLSHSELIIHLCRLVTEKIPIFILPPKGEPPEGYQFLDIWPQRLYHVVSGPEEDVKRFQEQGLELYFDLSAVSKDDLDALSSDAMQTPDEISFTVPESWKRVRVPFLNNSCQTINGQEAKQLRIDFLKKSLIQLESKLPIRMFYPLSSLSNINPATLSIQEGEIITNEQGIYTVNTSLFVNDVSRLFLDIVKDNIEIVVVPEYKEKIFSFTCQIQFIEPDTLEEKYISHMTPHAMNAKDDYTYSRTINLQGSQGYTRVFTNHNFHTKHQTVLREKYLKARFRDYMQRFQLLFGKHTPFQVDFTVKDGKITISRRLHENVAVAESCVYM